MYLSEGQEREGRVTNDALQETRTHNWTWNQGKAAAVARNVEGMILALDLVLTKWLGVSSHLMPVGWMWIMLFGRFPQARFRKPVKGFSPPGTRGGLLSAIVSRKINERSGVLGEETFALKFHTLCLCFVCKTCFLA